ncbi:MAG TPA: AI-2E family transporter YdiK [Methylomirabilota bacterium]|jgi:predicted PurR-regulated permease PerM|nr:AI-2E family transporter YdiK [Methylomirabilota bacterium]
MKAAALPWDITRILFAVVAIGGLIAASFWVLRPFLPATIWAVMIVIATWPEMRMIERRLWGRRSLAVVVMTLIMLALILVPVGIAVVTIVERAAEISAFTRSLAHLSVPAPPAWVKDLPVVGERIATGWQNLASLRPEDLASRATPYLLDVGRWLISQAGSVLGLFVHLLLTLAVSALLYAQGETAAAWVLAFARRLAGGEGERVARLSAQAIRAIALGIVVTALLQSVFGGIGLAVTGVPHPALLTAIMFLLGVAQIGAVPVLLGGVIWLYWQNETLWGTVMLVWSVITGTLDNLVRPLLIRQGADLPLLLVFAGVLGGLLAFGIIGLFVGPVVLAVSYTLLLAWVDEGRAAKE